MGRSGGASSCVTSALSSVNSMTLRLKAFRRDERRFARVPITDGAESTPRTSCDSGKNLTDEITARAYRLAWR